MVRVCVVLVFLMDCFLSVKAMNGDPDVDMTPVLGEAWAGRSKTGQSSKLDTASKVWERCIDAVRSSCSA